MTRKQAKKLLPIITAWTKGKKVQAKSKYALKWHKWYGFFDDFENSNLEFRLKPESQNSNHY